MKRALLFLCACGAPPKNPSLELAKSAAIMIVEDTSSPEMAELVLSTNTTITTMPGVFDCGGKQAWGCTSGYYDDYKIRVAGDPNNCLFKWDLAHEYTHVWICQSGYCDHDHSNPVWLVLGKKLNDAIATGCLQ